MLIDSFESLPQEYFGPSEKLVILQNYITKDKQYSIPQSPPESVQARIERYKNRREKNIFKKANGYEKPPSCGRDFLCIGRNYEEHRGVTNKQIRKHEG